MNITTEQVFIVNSAELDQQNPLQRSFAMPVPLETMQAEDTQSSLCLAQEMGPPSRTQMCRLCATVTELVVPIFEGEGLQNNLADKIHQHLPIQVSVEDVLPVVLCFQCTSTLLAWHELVACCVQADVAMRARRLDRDRDPPQQLQLPKDQSSSDEIKDEKYSMRGSAAGRPEDEGASDNPAPAYREPSLDPGNDPRRPDPTPVLTQQILSKASLGQNSVTKQPGDPSQKSIQPLLNVEPKTFESDTIISSTESIDAVNTESTLDNSSSEHIERKLSESESKAPERTNEFSDHSDTDSEFGKLPESVFDAIEDSQDAHSEDDQNTAETENPDAKKSEFPRPCPVCEKLCNSLSGWYYHMRRAHGSHEYACDACGKVFASNSDLATHARTHTKEKLFACRSCPSVFTSRAGRYIHEETHTQRRQHACERCPRAFRWRAQLARHLARHADDRRHACGQCGRAFSVTSDLRRHAAVHLPGCHRCDLCRATFKQKRYLKVHMENIHMTDAKKPCRSRKVPSALEEIPARSANADT